MYVCVLVPPTKYITACVLCDRARDDESSRAMCAALDRCAAKRSLKIIMFVFCTVQGAAECTHTHGLRESSASVCICGGRSSVCVL